MNMRLVTISCNRERPKTKRINFCNEKWMNEKSFHSYMHQLILIGHKSMWNGVARPECVVNVEKKKKIRDEKIGLMSCRLFEEANDFWRAREFSRKCIDHALHNLYFSVTLRHPSAVVPQNRLYKFTMEWPIRRRNFSRLHIQIVRRMFTFTILWWRK